MKKHKLCQRLVKLFCANTNNWPKEIKIAQQLLDICPNFDAWSSLSLTKDINSLSFFFTEDGGKYIPRDTTNPYMLDRQPLDIHENIVLGTD